MESLVEFFGKRVCALKRTVGAKCKPPVLTCLVEVHLDPIHYLVERVNLITSILKFGEIFAQSFGLSQCCFECDKVTLTVCLLALFLSFTNNLLVKIREVPGYVRHEHVIYPPELVRNESDLLARIEPVYEVVEEGGATAT